MIVLMVVLLMVFESPFYILFRSTNHLVKKFTKNQKSSFLKKINKSILSPITFYFEDDDYKSVDFNNENVLFTCQLIKIKNMDLYNSFCTYAKGIHTII